MLNLKMYAQFSLLCYVALIFSLAIYFIYFAIYFSYLYNFKILIKFGFHLG